MAQRPTLDLDLQVPKILFERMDHGRDVQSDLNFGVGAKDQ